MQEKVLLLIIDGFGINESSKGNAIAAARMPAYKKFRQTALQGKLKTCGKDVGLPADTMGNSEVGHLNIGAGRIVYQLNTMIDSKIETGDFFSNSSMLKAIVHCQKYNSNLHLCGLLSDGNVHSFNQHLYALLEFCHRHSMPRVYLHAFMDGRDTPPDSGLNFIKEYEEKAVELGIGKIVTVSGRYYAMDRDKRWDRVELAYQAMVYGKGERFPQADLAVSSSYEKDITDEFIIPKVISSQDKDPVIISDNDSVIFFNFRADRARQLTRAFVDPHFADFPVKNFSNLKFICFSEYDETLNPYVEICFHLPELKNILGEIVAAAGMKQLRLAETEKYAHVTFFFNGGREKPYPGEDRIMVPSPKVATYDLQPEMSAFLIRDKLVHALQEQKYELIITNFANCDMVGHSGDFSATVKAVESVDSCLKEIIPAAVKNDYAIILTADHGNADKMLDESGNIFTAHSKNPVPFLLYTSRKTKLRTQGILADIAPSILELLNLNQPAEMTGKSMLKEI